MNNKQDVPCWETVIWNVINSIFIKNLIQPPKFMETLKQKTCSKHWNSQFCLPKIQHYKSIISNDVFMFMFKFSPKAAEFHEFEFDSIDHDRYHSDPHRT